MKTRSMTKNERSFKFVVRSEWKNRFTLIEGTFGSALETLKVSGTLRRAGHYTNNLWWCDNEKIRLRIDQCLHITLEGDTGEYSGIYDGNSKDAKQMLETIFKVLQTCFK
jgi:hypothetical protein